MKDKLYKPNIKRGRPMETATRDHRQTEQRQQKKRRPKRKEQR